MKKLTENWSLEEMLAGNKGYKKSQRSEHDLTKKRMDSKKQSYLFSRTMRMGFSKLLDVGLSLTLLK